MAERDSDIEIPAHKLLTDTQETAGILAYMDLGWAAVSTQRDPTGVEASPAARPAVSLASLAAVFLLRESSHEAQGRLYSSSSSSLAGNVQLMPAFLHSFSTHFSQRWVTSSISSWWKVST